MAYLSKKLGATDKEIILSHDIFETLYSAATLDPISFINNVYTTQDDFRRFTGRKKDDGGVPLLKSIGTPEINAIS